MVWLCREVFEQLTSIDIKKQGRQSFLNWKSLKENRSTSSISPPILSCIQIYIYVHTTLVDTVINGKGLHSLWTGTYTHRSMLRTINKQVSYRCFATYRMLQNFFVRFVQRHIFVGMQVERYSVFFAILPMSWIGINLQFICSNDVVSIYTQKNVLVIGFLL